MYIEKDLAENEKDASLNAQEENKELARNNRSKRQSVYVKASINGGDDVKANIDSIMKMQVLQWKTRPTRKNIYQLCKEMKTLGT